MPQGDATRLGILSDTHGHAEACRAALDLLLEMGAEAFAHCGDVGEEAVLDLFTGHRTWFVWGNTDLDRIRLKAYADDLGLHCLGNLGRFTLGGKQFVLTHGDDAQRVAEVRLAAEEGRPVKGQARPDDYLLTGHTHVPHDRRIGELRWVNPGALYRARPRTVALLDVTTDDLVLRELDL